MAKSSKAERKENKIQQLERELASVKKKNTELQQLKKIHLDDEQLQSFLDNLTQRIEWSTNRIVDEMPKTTFVHTTGNQPKDGFSLIIKLTIASLFLSIFIITAYSLYKIWGDFWSAGWVNRISLFIFAVIGFDCLILSVEIIKEKDRNYIISLFSALVALVALIVTLVK